MAERLKSLAMILVLVVGGSVVGLVIAEAAVRVSGVSAMAITDPLFERRAEPGVSYAFRPGARGYVWGRTAAEINSLGLRGPEVSPIKPADTIRIGIFGDSVTFGQGVPDHDTYARVLERTLRERLQPRGINVEVLNFGVPAYSIVNEVSSFTEKGTRLGLDIAVLAPILEDYGFQRNHTADDYGYPVSATTPLKPGLMKNWLRHVHLAYVVRDFYLGFRGTDTQELRALTNGGSDLAQATWERADAELTRFAHVAQERSIIPIYLANGQGESQELDRILDALGITRVEMKPVLDRYDADALRVSEREGHPSVFQHRLIADALLKVIGPLVEPRGDKTAPHESELAETL